MSRSRSKAVPILALLGAMLLPMSPSLHSRQVWPYAHRPLRKSVALAAPLDTADCVYRAAAYDPDNTLLPNEGLRSEPLTLGETLGTEAHDPAFVSDGAGNYLLYTLNQGQFATCAVPVSVLNGDVTFALRYRTTAYWADRLLLSIIDMDSYGIVRKRFMLHQTSGNKYMARFWATDANASQIPAISTTSVSTSRTDDIVVTSESATKTLKLYINGVLEAIFVSLYSRQDAVSAPLCMPAPTTTLKPAGKVYALAVYKGVWTQAQVSALNWN